MRVIKFWILFFGIILLSTWLSSCVSTQQRARNLVSRGTKLIEKGMRLDPSVADTIKGVKDVVINVPGDSGKMEVKPEIDTVSFDSTMEDYDRSLLKIDSLNDLLKSGNLTKQGMESVMADQKKAIEALKKDRDRIRNGFLKDSTYVYEDSLLRLDVIIRGGKLIAVKHKVKDRTVSKKVETNTIQLDGRTIIQPWRQTWFWIMGLLILVLLLVIFLLLKR